MKLKDVNFPVYMLPKYSRTENVDGILYLYTRSGHKYILDDTNLGKKIFANRRMDMMRKANQYTVELYNPKKRCGTLAQLLEKGGETVFIDNVGKVFRYKKGNKMCPIKSYRVKFVKEVPGFGSLIYTDEGVQFTPVYYEVAPKYAALLESPDGQLLLDTHNELPYHKQRLKL